MSSRGRRAGCVQAALALLFPVTSCWRDDPDEIPVVQRQVALPFSLEQVKGTIAVGRPAVYDRTALLFRGKPVIMKQLTAVFRVEDGDPVEAFRQWVAQISRLNLGRVNVQVGGDRGQWFEASAFGPYDSDQPPTGWAEVSLWSTEDGPVLVASVAQRGGAPTAPPPAPPSLPAAPTPPERVEDADRDAGDVLFVEQRKQMHVPAGARKLIPTLPTSSGTGGSTSVLTARDSDAAIRSLLEEASAHSSAGEVRGPTSTMQDRLEVIEASYVIPAGGWGFQVVSVRAEGDPAATLFITSSAD